MTDLIRKAVELLPGWRIYDGKYASLSRDMAETQEGYRFYLTDQIFKDYAAAELKRQVHALDEYRYSVTSFCDHTSVEKWSFGHGKTIGFAEGEDVTENDIRAIVESGVLQKADD